jgi:outer membrane biosynthesis protein TonB
MEVICKTCLFWGRQLKESVKDGLQSANCDANPGAKATDWTKETHKCASWQSKELPPVQVLLFDFLEEMKKLNIQIARSLIEKPKPEKKIEKKPTSQKPKSKPQQKKVTTTKKSTPTKTKKTTGKK